MILLSSAKLPVMVWIYGGGFVMGATVRYDGSELVGQSLAIVRRFIKRSLDVDHLALGFFFRNWKPRASCDTVSQRPVVMHSGASP